MEIVKIWELTDRNPLLISMWQSARFIGIEMSLAGILQYTPETCELIAKIGVETFADYMNTVCNYPENRK